MFEALAVLGCGAAVANTLILFWVVQHLRRLCAQAERIKRVVTEVVPQGGGADLPMAPPEDWMEKLRTEIAVIKNKLQVKMNRLEIEELHARLRSVDERIGEN